MACGVKARAATSRLGYAWRKRKMVVSDCAVQLLMVAISLSARGTMSISM